MLTQQELIAKIKKGIKEETYPAFIYKYRPDDCNTAAIITNNELWFSDPNVFNDPYDCQVPIDVEKSKDIVRQYFKGIGKSDNEINGWLTNPDKIQESIKKDVEKALSNLGVCSFSKLYDDILQWSHYADRHKGICFKFDLLELCKELDYFIPIPVHYQMELPHYNHCIEEQRKKLADILIKPKACCWRYEQEIRIVKQGLVTNSDNEDAIIRKRKTVYNAIALKEIIFGAKTSKETTEKYKKLCQDYSDKRHIPLFKMELGKGKYYELIKNERPL
jgi:hypothetical protein